MAEWVRFEDVRVLRETQKAIECVFNGGYQRWIPRSQLGDRNQVTKKGNCGILEVAGWLVDKWDAEDAITENYADPEWFTAAGERTNRESE